MDISKLIAESYNSYSSKEQFTIITKQELYSDTQGYLGNTAFEEFALHLGHILNKEIEENGNPPIFYLICISVDLRKSNKKSYNNGNKALQNFTNSVSDYFCFRIQGEKFNIIIDKKNIMVLKRILETENEDYDVYYGIVEEPFVPMTRNSLREYVEKGIGKMYLNKSDVRKTKKEQTVPAEFEETFLKKYMQTTYYFNGIINATKPIYKENAIWIFPTAVVPARITIPILLVTYDNVNGYNVKYGKNIDFGFANAVYNCTARFTTNGICDILLLGKYDKGDASLNLYNKFMGTYTPKWNDELGENNYKETLGKRIDDNTQIFPVKQNVNGYYDYILMKRKNNLYKENEDDTYVELVESGTIEINGKKYGVVMDEASIDLIEL